MKWRAWVAGMLHCAALVGVLVAIETGSALWVGMIAGFCTVLAVRFTISAAAIYSAHLFRENAEDARWEAMKR